MVAKASADPAAVTHRPGPLRAATIESVLSDRMLAASCRSRNPENPVARKPARPISQRDTRPPRTAWASPARAMTTPAAARIRPLLPRTPGMPISPANVKTQGRNAPVIMMAPAARPPSPTAPRQLRSTAQLRSTRSRVAVVRACGRTASMGWLTMRGTSRADGWTGSRAGRSGGGGAGRTQVRRGQRR